MKVMSVLGQTLGVDKTQDVGPAKAWNSVGPPSPLPALTGYELVVDVGQSVSTSGVRFDVLISLL